MEYPALHVLDQNFETAASADADLSVAQEQRGFGLFVQNRFLRSEKIWSRDEDLDVSEKISRARSVSSVMTMFS